MKLTDNKGVTTAEVAISIIILILFTSLIANSFYNYYISIQAKNRRTIATNALIDVIENVEIMDYEEVTQESVNTLINTLKTNGEIQTNYTIEATLQKYNEIQGNTEKKDLIKILTVTVSYKIGDKQETSKITRLIKK